MIRVTIEIDNLLAKRMQDIAALTHTTISDLIASALRLRYTSKYVDELKIAHHIPTRRK